MCTILRMSAYILFHAKDIMINNKNIEHGKRLDAAVSVRDMSKELKAGYRAMNAMHNNKR